MKIDEEAVENNTGKLQDKICYENWVKTEELNNPALLHDDHEILDDYANVKREDFQVRTKSRLT